MEDDPEKGWAMIRKVQIKNFKCLEDIQIDLERFTVFVGPNGSGKSSVLQALHLLTRAFRPNDVEGEAVQAMSRGATGAVEILAQSGDEWYRYRTHQTASGQSEGPSFCRDLATNEWKPWKPQKSSMALPASMLLHLETSKLVMPNPAAPDPLVMASDGTGLHAALASMALNDPDSWQALQTSLKRIIPTIRRLRHTPSQPAALLFDTEGAESLSANQVSEGTLLVLGLLAAFYLSGGSKLMLLDDFDRGLHPKAQNELIRLFRGLLQEEPDLQIVATTHSPYMLDSMEPTEVRMTVLGDDGATVCASLGEHPQFARWKDEMSPGELWSLFGEKWLLEQGAAK